VPAAPASAAPSARIAATCKPPDYPGQGYFTSLSVTRVSCATGRKVALAYYRCRIRNGRAGRCRSTVLKYRCSERRTTISTEINARVTCKRGSKRVVHYYQQNT
jgi:hypothetical protein